MKQVFWMVFIVGLVFLFSSCKKQDYSSGDLYTPTSADVTANATLEQLQQGHDLYQNNCKSCHYLYSPDDFSPSQWKSVIPKMAPNTNMTSAEVSLVTKYVTRGQ